MTVIPVLVLGSTCVSQSGLEKRFKVIEWYSQRKEY